MGPVVAGCTDSVCEPSVGSCAPPAVSTVTLPFCCVTKRASTSCEMLFSACARWFTRSAVLSPCACRLTICVFSPPIVVSAVFSWATPETTPSSAVCRAVP